MTARLPVPNGDNNAWGTILNDFLEVAHNADGSLQSAALSASGAELTANKDQPGGYAPLNGSSLVPAANLGTGSPTTSTYLRGDGTWTTPAGGSSSLASDTDVTIASPGDKQLLTYNSSSSKWENLAPPVSSVAGHTGTVTLTESDIANLTIDLDATEKTANKGAASGYTALNDLSQVSSANLPPGNLGIFFNRTASGSSNSEIFYMNNDGSDIRQITNDTSQQSWWPKISPDGSRLLFLRAPTSLTNYDSDPTQQSLWTCNIDGSNVQQILAQGWQGASSFLGTPNWHPNGRDVIFFGGSGSLLIYRMPCEGGTPVNIPITGLVSGATDTSISPDGTEILFCFNDNVYVAPISGGIATQLTSDGNTTQNTDPYYSFDGQTILFLTNFAAPDGTHPFGQWGLRTITRSGTNLTTLIDDGNVNSKGTWGEDGYIYFHRLFYGDSNWSLAKIRADGTGAAIRLTNGTVRDYMPDTHVSRFPRVPNHHANSHLLGGSDPLLWTLVHSGGTLANRPAASANNNGYYYFAVDVNGGTQFASNGTSWVQIAPGLTQAPPAHETTHLAGGTDALPWSTIHGGGALSSRPSAASTNAGYTYFATDTGVLYQSNGSSWIQLAPGTLGTPQILGRSGTPVSVVNSTAETNLFSQTITGAAANNIFRFRASGDWLNNSGSSVSYRYRMYLGASNLLLDTSVLNLATNANRGEWNLEGFLYVTTTTSERLAATLIIPSPSAVGWQLSTVPATGGANAAVDMTTNPALIFSVQLGTAVSTADCFLRAFYIEGIA